jgi:hypothetical protein
VCDLVELFLEFHIKNCLMIEGTFMTFRESMRITIDVAAFALDSKKSSFFVAVEAALSIFLLNFFFLFERKASELLVQLPVFT